MHSNDGHGIQPHITFHFQLFALFLRISSVCGRVFVYLFLEISGSDLKFCDKYLSELGLCQMLRHGGTELFPCLSGQKRQEK